MEELIMELSEEDKQHLKEVIVDCLRDEKEIQRIVLFGSFVHSASPHDVDIAIFQDTDETYLPLALKYRRLLHSVSLRIPLDVIPVRPNPLPTALFQEIEKGELIFER